MKNRKLFGILALCLVLLCAASTLVAAAPPTPTSQVKAAVDKVLDLVQDESLAPNDRDKKIEDLVRSRFDFQIMSQSILAVHWRKATPEQRERFIDLLTRLLEANYRGRISEYADQYSDERVEYASERVKGDRALVDTFIVTKEKKRIPISYKLVLQGTEWRVYDVVIEEVSLVSNYRSTYDEIVRREGFDGLFARMEKKIRELSAGAVPEP